MAKKTEVTVEKIVEQRLYMIGQLVEALAGNSAVYKGTAEDANKLPKLAAQIADELLQFIGSEASK